VLVAAVVLLVLQAAGSLVAAWFIGEEQKKTAIAYKQAEQRAQEAQERFLLARESVDEMVKISQEELADSPPLQELRRRLLESSLDYYQKLIDQRRDDPAAQAELATTQKSVQQILDDLAVLQGAWHLRFLDQPPVLDDLHATGEQRERICALRQQFHESFSQFYLLTPEQKRK